MIAENPFVLFGLVAAVFIFLFRMGKTERYINNWHRLMIMVGTSTGQVKDTSQMETTEI